MFSLDMTLFDRMTVVMPSKPALGLYFTDQFIEVSRISGDGTRLVDFGQLNLPVGVIVNGEIKDAGVFRKALRQLLESTQHRSVRFGDKTVIGVSDNRVFLREFTIPKYAGKEIEEAIDYQVRSLLPVLPVGVETDWQIIGHNLEGEIEVLMAAVPKTVVASYLAAATDVGLKVAAVEPAVFANVRVIKHEQMKGKDQLLVYLGDTFAEFTYLTNGHPRFSDYLPDTEIAKKGGISNSIRDYVIFSNSKHPTRPIREIIISGFNSQTETLVADFQAKKVAAYLATSRLAGAETNDHNLLHTSAGLSLKTFDGESAYNLLPLEFRFEMIRERLIGRWKVVLILLTLLTMVGIGGLFYVYRTAMTNQSDLDALAGSYREEINLPSNQLLISSASELNDLSDQLLLLREATGGESEILREIALITPEGVALTSLVYSRGPGSVRLLDPNSNWALTGVAVSRQLVLDFFNRLLTTEGFKNGRLYFGSLEKEAEVNFRIASQLAP